MSHIIKPLLTESSWHGITIEPKNKTMETKVTTDDILHWLGIKLSKKDPPINELARIIADLVNGEYRIELARQEITDLKNK